MSTPDSPPESPDDTLFRRRRLRRPLPLWLRVMVFLAGWIVVLIGIAGLVLPGPGIPTIIAGAAILSIVSEATYELTRKSLQRWPFIWDRVEAFRERIHDRLHRFAHRKG
ncbi:MAG TPA: PGPGW domain-containing protein [Thermoanaerobaculia bacterium]|nr:PGPGW domain-containing protein [Thermoanaerobaculia bacterium]